MAIRPLDDRIVVKAVEAEEKSAGGILLPDTAKEKPQRARVVAVGEGPRNDAGERIPLTVKVGDEIIFGKYAGSEIKWRGDEYKILRESEVLALIGKSLEQIKARFLILGGGHDGTQVGNFLNFLVIQQAQCAIHHNLPFDIGRITREFLISLLEAGITCIHHFHVDHSKACHR